MQTEGRVSIVLTTRNRRIPVLNTLMSLCRLPGRWPIIVIDNGSTDGTAAAIAARFPSVMLIRSRRNLGAAARNIGAAYVHTPYIAFSDEDTRWEAGALENAAARLDEAPDIAVLNACVRADAAGRMEPPRAGMEQDSPARPCGPGPQLLDFAGGSCIMRTRAFHDVGGYWPPFFRGGEETLMALDMAEKGWRVEYARDSVSRCLPVRTGDGRLGERLRLRNEIWVAWMRRPLRSAWRRTWAQLGRARSAGMFWRTLADAAVGLPRALRRRRVISPAVERLCAALEAGPRELRPASFLPVMPPSRNNPST